MTLQTDGRMDGRTDGREYYNIPNIPAFSSKSAGITICSKISNLYLCMRTYISYNQLGGN